MTGTPEWARSGARARGVEQSPSGRETELGRWKPVSDAQVLAAVDRAERHRQRDGVVRSDIAAHLGFVHGSWTTRRLRPQLDALTGHGLLSSSRRHGVVVWAITQRGRKRLDQLRDAGEQSGLPESPQHRAWRHAHAAAGERIDGFRSQTARALEDAAGLLAADDAGSDAWFALADRLDSMCRYLGSAVYCSREWREPDDAHADVDDQHDPADERIDPSERGKLRSRRAGRRSIWRWPEPDSQK